MNPGSPPESDDAPNLAGVRVRPSLTVLLYLLLTASAAAALWVQSGAAGAPDGAQRAAAWVFLAFALGFSLYRVALVVAKKYSAGKAFFQVGIAALFCMVLLVNRAEVPGIGAQKSGAAATADIKALLADQSPVVRALAAEVVRSRQDASTWAPALVPALSDPDATVREEAHRSLVELNLGEDLGPAGDAAAQSAWKKRFP